jgi:hypothetical protein
MHVLVFVVGVIVVVMVVTAKRQFHNLLTVIS